MDEISLPYKKMIFVCTNARKPGERVSCAGDGRCGEALLQRLKSYVKEKNLADSVRVSKSGCQEKCELGPTVVILPDNKMVLGVTRDDVDTLIHDHLAPLSR